MNQNPLLSIQTFGQSVWLELIRRSTLSSRDLRQLIEEESHQASVEEAHHVLARLSETGIDLEAVRRQGVSQSEGTGH